MIDYDTFDEDYLNELLDRRDSAPLGSFAPQDAEGICVYCIHCKPCPVGLDVGLLNKCYDLSLAGDLLAL